MADKKNKGKSIAKHEGPDHSSPYPVSRLAPPTQLVDLARQIEKADQMIGTRVSSKLQVISDQIKILQDQAREVLEKARIDQDLHRVRCNFKRIPGRIYHLYAKEDDSRYFSMLSPDDWRGDPPDAYIGPYRLEADMSWTQADNRDEEQGSFSEMLTGLLHNRKVR